MEVPFRPPSLISKEYQNERPQKKVKSTRGVAPSLVQDSQNISINPEFINVTDTASLDKPSKTKVRIQVMKDYHRRRIQDIDDKRHARLRQTLEPRAISAKAQTQKFRLGEERILRPWTPKRGGKKRGLDNAKPAGKMKALREQGSSVISGSQVSSPEDASHRHADRTLSEPRLKEYGLNEPVSQATQEWISSLEFYMESSILYRSPSSGMLDPFGAMSLLITPRTQRLLHHYCQVFALNHISPKANFQSHAPTPNLLVNDANAPRLPNAIPPRPRTLPHLPLALRSLVPYQLFRDP